MKLLFYSLVLALIFSFNAACQDEKSEFVIKSGDVFKYALPAVTLAATLIFEDDTKGAIQCVTALGATAVATYALKYSLNKPRPNGGEYAFPSGHTSITFASASFIHKRYGINYAIPFYVLASYTGWSRIYAEEHDIWDVTTGVAIGACIGYLITQKYDNKDVNMSLSVLDDGAVLGFNYKF